MGATTALMALHRQVTNTPQEGHGYNPKTRKFDCERCGACCTPGGSWRYGVYVELNKGDEARLIKAGKEESLWESYIRTKETQANGTQCAFLRGTVGARCHCAVYPIRPKACRQFEPGSVQCLEAREEKWG